MKRRARERNPFFRPRRRFRPQLKGRSESRQSETSSTPIQFLRACTRGFHLERAIVKMIEY